MFALPDSWVWDFWIVDDGDRYHLFFLFASRALHDPEARHHRAAIGHAISTDLAHWIRVEDALVHSDAPAFDDLAIWTGCIVRHPDGRWLLFYTGATLRDGRNVQSIGIAVSDDLMRWERLGQVLSADPRWYERATDGLWHDEAFRDPWVYRDGSSWRMLITARANVGSADDRGVIGTAVSEDLLTWTLEPPMTSAGMGFAQLEVTQTVQIEGRGFLIFNCLAGDLSRKHREAGATGGVWITPIESGPRPFDPRSAVQLTGPSHYVGRVVETRDGKTVFLSFRNADEQGSFIGGVTDPMPIRLLNGRPSVTELEGTFIDANRARSPATAMDAVEDAHS